MNTCDFHQMTSFLGIEWLIQSKFVKNNNTTLLNQTNCRISELEILRVKIVRNDLRVNVTVTDYS